MKYHPQFGDIAHLGHIELLTPQFQASLAFFKNVFGLHECGHIGQSVFLRGWADYEQFTLQRTRSETSGLGHVAFRARSAVVLEQFVEVLEQNGVTGVWRAQDFGHGPAFRFASPDGHQVEIYYETQKFKASGDQVPGYKNLPQRYSPHGVAPKRLDHLNLLTQDIRGCRLFFHDLLGLRVTEQIVFEGDEMGAWLAATNKSYDLAFTRDRSSASGRFHHLTYMMDSREDVLRAEDILTEAGIPIETGPHKHSVGQTFFLYFYEPGGNRLRDRSRRLPHLRPRLGARRLEPRRALARPGMGPCNRIYLPHLWNATGEERIMAFQWTVVRFSQACDLGNVSKQFWNPVLN